jgi:hypothetical protein
MMAQAMCAITSAAIRTKIKSPMIIPIEVAPEQ